MPACANDINVLNASPLSNKIASGAYPPPIEYTIAGEKRSIPYCFADGIYPKWPCFLQTVSHPVTQKEKLLASCQEERRKDIERAFGVLQAKWHIIVRPSRLWNTGGMKEVMRCCIVLHNMMVEDGDGLSGPLQEASENDEESGNVLLGNSATPMWALHCDDES